MTSPTDPIDRARRLRSVDAARALYDDWAERYDDDVFGHAGVTGSRTIADLLASRVADRATPIVDLGCGTGAVGSRLAAHGFTDLTGVDLSSGMLDVAGRLGVYTRLVEADLTLPVDVPTRFGASVSAGTFATGHVTAEAVPHLLALHQPGALLAWVVAPSLWPTFDASLTASGVTVESSDPTPIRRAGDDRSHMVIATLRDGPG